MCLLPLINELGWCEGAERKQVFMACNQDPQRAAEREEKPKPETGIRAVKTRQMPGREGKSCGLLAQPWCEPVPAEPPEPYKHPPLP